MGLFLLSLIGISFVGGAVSYGFFFFMLLTPVISLLYAVIVFFRFKIYQRLETKTAVVGTPAAFYFTLQNEDYFAHAGIGTEFFSDFSSISGVDQNGELELLPHTGVSRETRLICKYRGEYEVGVRRVTVTDYLRLFSVTLRNRETLKVTVLPRLELLEHLRYLDERSVSARPAQAESEPDVLLRDYISGDDLRSINWKATARTGKPLVRKRTGEELPGISLIMDACRYCAKPEAYLPLENKLLEIVLALASYYLEHGIPTGVYSCEQQPIRFLMRGPDAFEPFYEAMAMFGFREEATQQVLFSSFGGYREILEGNAVILVLHEWSEAAAIYAEQLGRLSIPVMVYLVTDRTDAVPEESIPGQISFLKVGYEDRLQEVL